MTNLVPVGLAYENGQAPIRVGMHVTGATSMAYGQVAEKRGNVLYLKEVAGDFLLGERLVCSAGGHGVVGELNVLDRLANEL